MSSARQSNALRWMTVAAMLAVLTWLRFDCSFPLFTLPMLLIPASHLLLGAMPADLGLRALSTRPCARVMMVALFLMLGMLALLEPLTHCYASVLALAAEGSLTDTHYAWLSGLGGQLGLLGMVVYGGGVVFYASELFFRGWLLERLRRRLPLRWAVLIQAVLFGLTALPVGLLLPWPQGIIYAVVYQGFGVGVIAGWAAAATHSIWPGYGAVVLANLVLIVATL